MPPIFASAPGSLMLLGEHAVLHKRKALVCAINRRVSAYLTPRKDDTIHIVSELGTYTGHRKTLKDDPSLRFVLQAIRTNLPAIPSGFDLRIESEFSADIGFGSSAAVTVATHGALMKWLTSSPTIDSTTLFNDALKTVHTVQGRGSGADLAASVFGGIVAYDTTPSFHLISIKIPLTAIYCGYKTSTTQVIQHVESLRKKNPEKYEELFTTINDTVEEAVKALEDCDLHCFGKRINSGQRLMDQLGVNTPELAEIAALLQNDPAIVGAKISGSGLGDCVVGIGRYAKTVSKYPVYNIDITSNGVCFTDSE